MTVKNRHDMKKPPHNKTSRASGYFWPPAFDSTMAAAEVKEQYSAILLGATGNVGGASRRF